jgi:glycerol-3-phosphate acyltransferase PlsY
MSKAKEITHDIVENSQTQRTIFRVLISSLILLSLVYVYLIGAITFNVLARKSLDTTVRTLGSHVSELELSYLNETNSIDKSYALAQGFVDTQKSIFATRGASSVAIR